MKVSFFPHQPRALDKSPLHQTPCCPKAPTKSRGVSRPGPLKRAHAGQEEEKTV